MGGSTEPSLTKSNRDYRVDLFRGLALLIIFVDHQEALAAHSCFRCFTLMATTYCDALEVFLFISGYVCGIAYGRTLATKGFLACQAKAVRRCMQLYLANAALFLFIVGIAVISSHQGDVINTLNGARLRYALDAPFPSIGVFLTARYHPLAMEILHLYIVFLLIAPAMLWIASRSAVAALAASYAVYLLAQIFPFFDYYTSPDGLNPFAWQLLYCAGLFIGMLKPAWVSRTIKSGPLLAASVLGLATAVTVRKLVPSFFEIDAGDSGFWGQMIYSFPATSRPALHPLRLLSFLFLACVAVNVCPASAVLEKSWPARRLIQCGRHSLTIFCVSVAMNYWVGLVAVPACKSLPISLTVPALDIAGIVVLLTLAWLLSLRRTSAPMPVKINGPQRICESEQSSA